MLRPQPPTQTATTDAINANARVAGGRIVGLLADRDRSDQARRDEQPEGEHPEYPHLDQELEVGVPDVEEAGAVERAEAVPDPPRLGRELICLLVRRGLAPRGWASDVAGEHALERVDQAGHEAGKHDEDRGAEPQRGEPARPAPPDG